MNKTYLYPCVTFNLRRKKDIRQLTMYCRRAGLSRAQTKHLQEKVFYCDEALDYFLEMRKKPNCGEDTAIRYLVGMAPPRSAYASNNLGALAGNNSPSFRRFVKEPTAYAKVLLAHLRRLVERITSF